MSELKVNLYKQPVTFVTLISLSLKLEGQILRLNMASDTNQKGEAIVYSDLPFDFVGFTLTGESESLTRGTTATLSISNKDRKLTNFIKSQSQFKGGECVVYHLVFESLSAENFINNAKPEAFSGTTEKLQRVKKYKVEQILKITNEKVDFKLSGLKGISTLTPPFTMRRLCCYDFKDKNCKYTGSDSSCGKTYKDCRLKENLSNFGGLPNEE